MNYDLIYERKFKQEKREMFKQSRLFTVLLNGHLSEASVIDSKYIKMTGLQVQKQPPKVFCKKKVYLKICEISQENTCVGVSF